MIVMTIMTEMSLIIVKLLCKRDNEKWFFQYFRSFGTIRKMSIENEQESSGENWLERFRCFGYFDRYDRVIKNV